MSDVETINLHADYEKANATFLNAIIRERQGVKIIMTPLSLRWLQETQSNPASMMQQRYEKSRGQRYEERRTEGVWVDSSTCRRCGARHAVGCEHRAPVAA